MEDYFSLLRYTGCSVYLPVSCSTAAPLPAPKSDRLDSDVRVARVNPSWDYFILRRVTNSFNRGQQTLENWQLLWMVEEDHNYHFEHACIPSNI